MTKKMVRPTFDRVLIRRDEAVKQIGTIILADQSVEVPAEGTIVAIGPDVDRGQFSVGDHVSFGKYSGITVVVNANTDAQEAFSLLKEDEILTVEFDADAVDIRPASWASADAPAEETK